MPAFQLPNLVWTPNTKVGAEALVYFNRTNGYKLGTYVKGTSGQVWMPNSSCAQQVVNPIANGGFMAMLLSVINGGNVGITGANNSAAFASTDPLGSAYEIEGVTDATTLTMTGSVTGDQVDIIALPPPTGDILICYDQGLDVKIGEVWKPIPRKFSPADHYVRQRAENSISLKDLYVCNWEGLRSINGVPVTMIVKIYPSGGAVPSEIQYYTNVRLNVPPMMLPGDANASLEFSGEAKFDQYASFAAKPTFGQY